MWVKKDPTRFPRMQSIEADGRRKTLDAVTPLFMRCAEADAKVFGKLLEHVKEIDADRSTVLILQIDNECEVLGDSRDRCALAEAAFSEPVRESLLHHLAKKPHSESSKRFLNVHFGRDHHWEELFGVEAPADKMFMAFHSRGTLKRS